MMKRFLMVTLAAGLLASTVSAATQLNVRVVSDGSSAIGVSAGEVVNYQVLGVLADTNNQGLALFAFTLSYDCGNLEQASPPTEAQTPGITECLPGEGKGMTNPAGFGGTLGVLNQEGDLVQVGCAFNTILNTIDFAPFPLGSVMLDIGHTETVLAQGQLTIPSDATEGQECTLSISQVIANTILNGEVDDGTHWAVEAAAQGNTDDLVMTVGTLCAVASASTPGCNGVLPRIEGNLIRIQYDSDPTPQIPSVLIQELLSDGLFGADVTSSFDIVNVGGNVLKLTEKDPVDSAVLNDTWYGITDGCNEIHFVVKYGDVNGDGATNAFDVNDIWGNRASVAPNESPFDINGDGAINAFDVNDAWGNRGPTPEKPSGHDICPPSP